MEEPIGLPQNQDVRCLAELGRDALGIDALGVDGLDLDGHGVPALFRRIQGTWQGRYYKVSPAAICQRAFDGTFTIAISADRYHQTNRYSFDDGSTTELVFSGTFAHGVLTMQSDSRRKFSGRAWQAAPDLILFESHKEEGGVAIRYLEMICFDTPGSRARTTLEYRDGVFAGVNFIREVKV